MSRRPSIAGSVILIALTIGLIVLRYGYFLSFPDNKVIEPYGDGFKAYTVIWYHAKYDSTYSHFEGMNYPYGEHAVPAATQPFLSGLLRFISRHFVDITGFTIHAVHLSMLLGIFLCSLFLFLTFRRLQTSDWFAVAAALGLTFLAPQTHRMYSHYGLAHPEVIPIIIYLLLRWHEKPARNRSIWIGLVVTIYSMIHFYYFAILSFLISFFMLFRFLQKPATKPIFKTYLPHYGIQIIAPLAFFFFWMIYNSPVTDRTSMPWGYLYYSTNLQGLFTSFDQPFFKCLQTFLAPFKWIDFEKRAYVGMLGGLFSIFLLVRWLLTRLSRPLLPVETTPEGGSFLKHLLWTAVITLLFATGLPFVISGLEGLLRYTGPIKMFRGVGRFAWIFYYTINVIALLSIWKWIKASGSIYRQIAIALPVFALLGFEAYHHSKAYSIDLDEITEFNTPHYYRENSGIDFSRYQALLTIPYYNVGSDNFWVTIPNLGLILQKSLLLSIESGLPTTSAMLTRSSLSQTLNQIQLVTEPYRYPKILEDFPSEKPLLVVWDQPRYLENKHLYGHFEGKGTLLFEDGPLRLLELPLSVFRELVDLRRDTILREIRERILFPKGEFLVSDSAAVFFHDGFDSEVSAKPYHGEGGLQVEMQDSVLILDESLPGLNPDTTYKISFWAYVRQDLLARSSMHLYELDANTGRLLQTQRVTLNQESIHRVFDSNGWALMEYPFKPAAPNSRFIVSVSNPDLRGKVLFFDEVMLRPAATDLYQKQETYFQKNNRIFSSNR